MSNFRSSKKDDDDPDAEDGNTGPDKTMDQLEKGPLHMYAE